MAANEQPVRLMYGFPHVVEWLNNDLPSITTLSADPAEGRQTPLEQVDFLLHEFIGGADLSYYERSHFMEPLDGGIWELKTTDVRFFGWFVCRGIFIAANIDSAYRCKLYPLYEGYKTNTIHRRNLLDLDDPKFIIGGYDDVF